MSTPYTKSIDYKVEWNKLKDNMRAQIANKQDGIRELTIQIDVLMHNIIIMETQVNDNPGIGKK